MTLPSEVRKTFPVSEPQEACSEIRPDAGGVGEVGTVGLVIGCSGSVGRSIGAGEAGSVIGFCGSAMGRVGETGSIIGGAGATTGLTGRPIAGLAARTEGEAPRSPSPSTKEALSNIV